MAAPWVCPLCGHANAPWVAQCPCIPPALPADTSRVIPWQPWPWAPGRDSSAKPLPESPYYTTCTVTATTTDGQYRLVMNG